jgi:cytochrome c1
MNDETMNPTSDRLARKVRTWLVLLIACSCLLAACTASFTNPGREFVLAGDPQEGRDALRAYGCGACHVIPGVPGANATVGPPLENWASRYYIAGTLNNTPEELIDWIRYPQTIEPGTAMPDLDVTEQDARNMAAYLYTLRDE